MSEIDAYKKMYQPVEQLTETTVPDRLKHIPESWDHHSLVDGATKEKMRDALGGTFTHFPLDSHTDVDPEVHEHLINHGYSIEDYKAGLASKTVQVGNPDRGIPYRLKKITKRIGAIIDETGAPDHVKKAYENDPARGAAKQSDLHVVISTSPLAIAGMTTGTNWHNESCMELEGGAHKSYLSSDSAYGTHVAFLVHKDDKTAFEHGEPSHPIARIAIKPFHSEESNDVIFRPEGRAYGASNNAFASAVAKWSHEKYPAKQGERYTKHSAVYSDDNQDHHEEVSTEDLHEMLKSGGKYFPRGVYLPRHKIDMAMDGLKNGAYDANRVMRISNLSPLDVKTISKLHPDSLSIQTLATEHGNKFSEHMIRQYVAHVSSLPGIKGRSDSVANAIPKAMLANSKLPQEIVDSLHPMKYPYVRRNKLTIKHLEHAMSNLDPAGVEATQHLAQEHHLHSLVKNGFISASAIVSNPKFSQAVHDQLLADGNTKHLVTSPFAKLSDIQRGDDIIRLSRNPHIDHTQPHLKDLFMAHVKKHDPTDYGSTLNGVIGYQSANLVPANISKHMTDEDFDLFPLKKITTAFADKEDNKRYINRIVHTAINSPDNASRISHAADELQFFADEHASSKPDKETSKFIYDHAVNLWPKLNSKVLQDQTMNMIMRHKLH